MTKRDKVGDLVARSDNTNRKKSVRDRVLQRKKILTTWMKEGVPDNKRSELPRSLRQAADWSDDELGIHRIKSPNDFTKTHPVWGKQVSEIASLITL
ncbi:MAG: hypothetical protein WAR01_15455, partial [Dokdonella sp.]|uniref:hypothetical protein n=1 Tax=Dokdonella sp. TaxID=2291710 RepID=UPI003BB04885